MRELYFDCSMGAAGDMIAAALLGLFDNREEILEELNRMMAPCGVSYALSEVTNGGIAGLSLQVMIDGEPEDEAHYAYEHHTRYVDRTGKPAAWGTNEHEHRDHPHADMETISRTVNGLDAPEYTKQAVLDIYRLIAEAESRVHGVSVSDIHFHEVGRLDAIADILAVSWLKEKLGEVRITASSVNVGSGQVHCAHGILPVPAPATAELLKDIPFYTSEINGELCTPTGAALLGYYSRGFGKMPDMRVSHIGRGAGKKQFERANVLTAYLGVREVSDDWEVELLSDEACYYANSAKKGCVDLTESSFCEQACELSCNIDDMTGEELGSVFGRLFEAGALDVYTIPIGMKSNRPAVMLNVICKKDREREFAGLMLRLTSTLGVRVKDYRRYMLEREVIEYETEFGPVRVKHSYDRELGIDRYKPEYADVDRIARETGRSFTEISRIIEKSIRNN